MFHVLLALPVLAAFGAVAGIILCCMGFLLALAFLGQLILCLFCKTLRWLLWVPALIGILGLILCILVGLPVSLTVIFLFWGLYEIMALCGWAVSKLLRKLKRLMIG